MWSSYQNYICESFCRFDYSVSADRANQFYSEIRKYYPDLKDGSLEPSYAGIRPKLSGPGHGSVDFIIQVTKFLFFPSPYIICYYILIMLWNLLTILNFISKSCCLETDTCPQIIIHQGNNQAISFSHSMRCTA